MTLQSKILIGLAIWAVALTFILSLLRIAKLADERMAAMAYGEEIAEEGGSL